MSANVPVLPDPDANDEAEALASAVALADEDTRTVAHEEMRAWLLRLACGDLSAPPPPLR